MANPLDVAGPVAKPLRLGLLGFAIAAAGAILGLLVDYRQGNPLAYLAFGLVVTGVVLTFGSVGWGWVSVARKLLGRK
ncbi:hypothetical protein [Limnobacter sp.]|uniref:hypothetical protein n=1 Tax=Limnobacter sp. TaxID=2003368 RepID=UPI0027325728|nr:hypothetical protein [Limnobacter sp.]MDP3270773.1 hypothetical protein [Limnobacter sp.]